jgi:hypothetical protein
MKTIRVSSRLMLLACLIVLSCTSAPPAFNVLQERPADPALPPNPVAARVLVFVSNDCPIANRYCPEFRRLHDAYAPRGVAFWLVHSDPEETLDRVRQHDREYNLNLPSMLDHDHSLARLGQAEIIPSAAVFNAAGHLVYHGRIDDRFADLGRERPEPSRHDLQEAIEAVLANRPVAVSVTKAVGCYIP